MVNKFDHLLNYGPSRDEEHDCEMDKHDHEPPHDEHKPFPWPKREMPHKPHPEHKEEKETIIKCGIGISPGPICQDNILKPLGPGSVPDGGIGSTHHAPVIASVVLDTRKLKDPTVKIEFSSLISFKTFFGSSYFLRLVFKLSRVCDGGHPVSLGTWKFEQAKDQHVCDVQNSTEANNTTPINSFASVQSTESFCFTWCQCEVCDGCCTYLVELVEQECFNIDFATIGNIFITGFANGIKKS